MTEADAIQRAFDDLFAKAWAAEIAKVNPKNAGSAYYHPDRVAARAADFAKGELRRRGLA